MGILVGIDIGGTFTDFFVSNKDTGIVHSFKVSSTPSVPQDAILRGIEQLYNLGKLDLDETPEISFVSHGTTVGTNALLERKGARLGMIATKGFGDILEIGRQSRPELYNFQADKVRPLVSREHVYEVVERVKGDGSIEVPITEQELSSILKWAVGHSFEAISVCLINSYINPAHEQLIVEYLSNTLPDLHVTGSARLIGELREVERFSTAAVNSYLMPTVGAYLQNLQQETQSQFQFPAIHVMQSDGSLASIPEAAQAPVKLCLSGPAAGVLGAGAIAAAAGHRNIITLDMGGTSTDVALLTDSSPELVFQSQIDGHLLKTPTLWINTIGAGGGSIAKAIDGLLKVGPESAGASPGPAAYGIGSEPTITDAHVALNRISDETKFGQDVIIDSAKAKKAIADIANKLDLSVTDAARGILDVANASICNAVNRISVERGIDPRDYTLVAFGGAGGLHAAEIAKTLGIKQVLIPTHPGTLSAMGLLVAEPAKRFARSNPMPLSNETLPLMKEIFAELERDAIAWFSSEKVKPEARDFAYSIDLRHDGQNFELNIPSNPELTVETVEILRARFLALHKNLYGYNLPTDPIKIVTFRLTAAQKIKQQIQPLYSSPGVRMVQPAENSTEEPPRFQRNALSPSSFVHGPCIIEQKDSTIWVPEGGTATLDRNMNLVISL